MHGTEPARSECQQLQGRKNFVENVKNNVRISQAVSITEAKIHKTAILGGKFMEGSVRRVTRHGREVPDDRPWPRTRRTHSPLQG
jgi:hypothetical protein